jgi:hypothetical protein
MKAFPIQPIFIEEDLIFMSNVSFYDYYPHNEGVSTIFIEIKLYLTNQTLMNYFIME